MNYQNVISYLGYLGPSINIIIFFILMFYELREKIITNKLFVFLIFGVILNSIFNLFLKQLFKQPRPKQSKPISILENPNSNGMPSGHAQANGFIISLSYFLNIPINLFIIIIFISLITFWQRHFSKMHFYNQLIAGTLFGLIFGIIYIYILKKNLIINKNKLKIK